MKLLGVECCGIMMPDSIQPREYSRGDGIDGTLHNPREPERQPLRAVPQLERQAVELELQLAGQQPERELRVCGSRNSLYFSPGSVPGEFCFSLRSLGGGCFCELPIPTSCHFSELIYFKGERDVFLVIDRLGFPEHHQEYFECVYFPYQYFYVGLFFFSWQEGCDGGRFCYLNEERVDALAEGMSMQLRQYLIVPIPDEIGAFYLFEQW